MTLDDATSDRLSRTKAAALRELVVRGVALSDRGDGAGELSTLVARAPLDHLVDAAWIHGLSGTLERCLGRVQEMPAPVLDDLRRDAEDHAVTGLVHLAALRDIGQAFDERGVSWLAMKGPVLAHFLYARPSDRSYVDLDLLVDRGDFQTAVEVLEKQGYQHKIKNWRLAEEMLAGQIELKKGSTRVDLHWHLHYSSFDRSRTALVPDEMLARARRIELPGQSVPTFDAVDTLLNLAYHAARSDGHRLIWLKDIERSLVVEQPDLDELVRRSRRSACGPQVGVMLLRSNEVLGVDVPGDIIDALVPGPLLALDRAARRLDHPVQFHTRLTLTRFVTRSIGRSTRSTITELPLRAGRQAVRLIVPSRSNETSDPIEKQRFFDAAAASRQ